MARTIRMFSSEFPYEGGIGDTTSPGSVDNDLIDAEEAYGGRVQASMPLERSQINDIGGDVVTAMFGGSPMGRSQNPTHQAAKVAHQEMWDIGRRLKAPSRIIWEPTGTSWGLASDGLNHAANYDRRMKTIAQKYNVTLFRVTPKSGGAPMWVFTDSPRALPLVARASGMQVTGISKAV